MTVTSSNSVVSFVASALKKWTRSSTFLNFAFFILISTKDSSISTPIAFYTLKRYTAQIGIRPSPLPISQTISDGET